MIVQIGPFCESGEEPRVLAVGRYGLEIAFDSQSSQTGRRIYSVTIDGSSLRPITKTMRYVGDFDW